MFDELQAHSYAFFNRPFVESVLNGVSQMYFKIVRDCVGALKITWILYHAFADRMAHKTDRLPLIVHWSY
jgi:hypothetical protein